MGLENNLHPRWEVGNPNSHSSRRVRRSESLAPDGALFTNKGVHRLRRANHRGPLNDGEESDLPEGESNQPPKSVGTPTTLDHTASRRSTQGSESATQVEYAAPKVVITPPLPLDGKMISDGGESEKQKGVLSRLLDLLKSVRPGSDITKFHVPVQLNMPKSQLQVYGESVYCCAQDLLGKCAEGETALKRFLNVVAWHISTTRPAPFGQAPLNPILGETHHVSCGDLNVLLEQVSHHPPVSALYATNEVKKFQLQLWHNACPRFYGSSVEATIQGRRSLKLLSHGENYEMTCPKLLIRFFPSFGSEWVGNTKIECLESGLEATVMYKGKAFFGLRGAQGKVVGKVRETKSNQVLYELNGSWNRVVTMKDMKTGDTSTLYDAQAALTQLKAPLVRNPYALAPTESVVVWSLLFESLVQKDWEAARAAKLGVEERERALAKQREEAGCSWSPKYFAATSDGVGWEWAHQGQAVGEGPMIVPP